MNTLILDDFEFTGYYPEFYRCGTVFETQEEIDKLIYTRTTASADHYRCPYCERETIDIPTKANP